MIFLSKIGDLMGRLLGYVYSRFCCRWCRVRRKKSEHDNDERIEVTLKYDQVGHENYMPTSKVSKKIYFIINIIKYVSPRFLFQLLSLCVWCLLILSLGQWSMPSGRTGHLQNQHISHLWLYPPLDLETLFLEKSKFFIIEIWLKLSNS